jgi:arylsulfatase A-like enzyme
VVRTVGIAVLSLALLAGCSDAPVRRPNVLLVSIDSLRADHLSCYGYARRTSPALDQLAQEGALFEQHVSSTSWTLPSHAAIFTGLFDSGHGCTDADKALEPRFDTLAERLKDHGYQTAGFFAGPFLHPGFGFAQGFDHYVDCTSQAGIAAAAAKPGQNASNRASHTDVANPRTFDAFQSWFAGRDERPFFAFVHLWDVHYDFTPPAPYDRLFDPDYQGWVTGRDFFFDDRIGPQMDSRDLAHLIALYDGEIAWTDTFLARIRERLEQAGILDDTLIVVTSDHGTEFFEHGWKGHRTTLYDEVLHVPLVVRYPARVPAGVRVAAQSRSVDVAPTILDLCSVAPFADVSGTTLAAFFRDAAIRSGPGARAISELDSVGRSLLSVRGTDWKVIGDRLRATTRTYDLRADPGEQSPIPDPDSPLVQTSLQALDEVGTELLRVAGIHAGESSGSKPPAEIEAQLRDLGYTGEDPGAATRGGAARTGPR